MIFSSIQVSAAEVESCSMKDVELHVTRVFVVSQAGPRLLLQVRKEGIHNNSSFDETTVKYKGSTNIRINKNGPWQTHFSRCEDAMQPEGGDDVAAMVNQDARLNHRVHRRGVQALDLHTPASQAIFRCWLLVREWLS